MDSNPLNPNVNRDHSRNYMGNKSTKQRQSLSPQPKPQPITKTQKPIIKAHQTTAIVPQPVAILSPKPVRVTDPMSKLNLVVVDKDLFETDYRKFAEMYDHLIDKYKI